MKVFHRRSFKMWEKGVYIIKDVDDFAGYALVERAFKGDVKAEAVARWSAWAAEQDPPILYSNFVTNIATEVVEEPTPE